MPDLDLSKGIDLSTLTAKRTLPRRTRNMQPINFDEVLDTIVERDPRYQREAYLFLRGALDHVTRLLVFRSGVARARSLPDGVPGIHPAGGAPHDRVAPHDRLIPEEGLIADRRPGVGVYRTWPIAPDVDTLIQRWHILMHSEDRGELFQETSDRIISGAYSVALTSKSVAGYS